MHSETIPPSSASFPMSCGRRAVPVRMAPSRCWRGCFPAATGASSHTGFRSASATSSARFSAPLRKSRHPRTALHRRCLRYFVGYIPSGYAPSSRLSLAGQDPPGCWRYFRAGAHVKVAAIVGPTAAGKTELSVEVAERLDAEIVSVDSMQIYRGMDIGTATPRDDIRARVEHHLIDVRDPSHELTVSEYQQLGRAAIEEISARG